MESAESAESSQSSVATITIGEEATDESVSKEKIAASSKLFEARLASTSKEEAGEYTGPRFIYHLGEKHNLGLMKWLNLNLPTKVKSSD